LFLAFLSRYINYFGCADWTANYADATFRKSHIPRAERGSNVTKVIG
jgi:hypothetical protein